MTWRIAVAAVSAAGFAIGLNYRLRAHLAGKRESLNRLEEGLPLLILTRLTGLSLVALMVLWLVRPQLLAWAEFAVADGVRVLGLVLVAAGFAWIAWVFHTLGTNLTDTVVTRRHHTLVTDGPYRWIRHPFYLGLPIAGLGASLATAMWLPFPLSLLGFVLLALRARKEEANLVARFGDAYTQYAAAKGRFFPQWR